MSVTSSMLQWKEEWNWFFGWQFISEGNISLQMDKNLIYFLLFRLNVNTSWWNPIKLQEMLKTSMKFFFQCLPHTKSLYVFVDFFYVTKQCKFCLLKMLERVQWLGNNLLDGDSDNSNWIRHYEVVMFRTKAIKTG